MKFLVFLILAPIFYGVFCRQNYNVPRLHTKNPRQSTNLSQYLTKRRQEIPVYIRIHIDPAVSVTLQNQYGRQTRRKIKFTTQKLIRDVNNIFKGLTADQVIKFKLIATKFLKNETLKMNENGTKYLRSYCNWQMKRKSKKWYYSVLLTGLDLYYGSEGNIVRRSRGRSYMQGMCHVKYSCTVLEFQPELLSFLLAHELAHSVGIFHDGLPNNKCKAQGFMMGAKFNVGNHPKIWSECSQKDFKKFLKSKVSNCLRPG